VAAETDAVDVATEHHVQDGDVIGEAERRVSIASSPLRATSTEMPASASPRARLPATSGSSSTTSTRMAGS